MHLEKRADEKRKKEFKMNEIRLTFGYSYGKKN